MKIVITGGIGVGKSTIFNLLKEEFLPSYKYVSVDHIVHELYQLPDIQNIIYKEFDTIDRKQVRDIVMKDPDKMITLQKFINPFIMKRLLVFLEDYENIIIEFPLYKTHGEYIKDYINLVIEVQCSEIIRHNRVLERDNINEEMYNLIVKLQQNLDKNVNGVEVFTVINDDLNLARAGLTTIVNTIKKRDRGVKCGIVSGSFDPITNGHLHIIKTALNLVDNLFIVVARNYNKKHMFDIWDRVALINKSIKETLTIAEQEKVIVDVLEDNELLVNYATFYDIKYIFRGIRNSNDWEYEYTLNLIQKEITENVETVYFITPRDKIEISSSMIKSTVDLKQADMIRIAQKYIPSCVMDALININKKRHP